MAADDVYYYQPPTYRVPVMTEGWPLGGFQRSTLVYRLNGVWVNQVAAGTDNPDPNTVDVDAASGLRLFFTKPMVVPGWLYDELSAIEPADPSYTVYPLIQL